MIPYTDNCFLVPSSTRNEDTGDMQLGLPISTICRIKSTSQMVRTYSGDTVVATAKIYFPPLNLITPSWKVIVNNKSYDLLKIDEIKELGGKVNHYVLYI